jgi:hypothetical protein
LGGFRLVPGNLIGDGGLARLFLLARVALGGRFALWLIGMAVRQMRRQVQNLEPAVWTPGRLRRARNCSSWVARDVRAPPDTRRARHDRPKRRRVDDASASAPETIRIGAPAAARALGWMIGFDSHQLLLVSILSVRRDRLDALRVVRRQA